MALITLEVTTLCKGTVRTVRNRLWFRLQTLSICNCVEIFIENTYLHKQNASTTIDTIKFLVDIISPTGFITFQSVCYNGGTSGKYIVKDSRSYDLVK